MGKVKVLNDNVINKIAAGEVIENPSSALKELVENSIDAGASRVCVEIEQAGMGLIRIADNGEGMSRDDAVLAIERHATSKLTNETDLYSLKTLGFRGEALPSIASISKFLLRTATKTDSVGTCVKIEGGKITNISDDNISPGTIIEIRNLFYNVPARKKFIRSFHSEKITLSQTFIKLALSHPEVDFILKDEDKEVYKLLGAKSVSDRIASIFGHDFIADLISCSHECDGVRFGGYISHPQLCRNTRSGQYFFVNSRVVQSYQLSQSIQRAYGTLLPSNRFPIVFLYMDLTPDAIDVNVHPTKREIKFSDLSKLEEMVKLAVGDALKKSKLVFDIREQTDELKKINLSYNVPRFTQVFDHQPSENKPMGFFSNSDLKKTNTFGGQNQSNNEKIGQDSNQPLADDEDDPFIDQLNAIIRMDNSLTESAEPAENTAGQQRLDAIHNNTGGTGKETAYDDEACLPSIDSPQIKVIGQIGKCFVIAEGKEGLVIIDQHAAHERINYEKIMALMDNNNAHSQSLMFPVTYQVDRMRKKAVLSKIGILNKAGIGISDFGADTFIIDSLPDFISPTSVVAVLDDLIEESERASSDSIDNWKMKLAKMIACRSSIKSADKMETLELQRLVEDLFKTQTPYTCPHGRPTVIRMSYEQLRHYFKRE